MYGKALGTTLVVMLSLTGPLAFAQPGDATEASVEGLASLASWLQDLAIEKKAERELKHTSRLTPRPGYADPNTFHRAFKRWWGMSPEAFRRERARPEA